MKVSILVLLLTATLTIGYAQSLQPSGFGVYEPEGMECVPAGERLRIEKMLKENIEQLKASGKLPENWGIPPSGNNQAKPSSGNFIWPLRNAAGLNFNSSYGVSNYVDLDPLFPNKILDWNCGKRSYDLASGYNHAGVDIFTWPFGQYLQEHSLVEIIAATDGIIIAKEDGNFDNNCSMDGGMWNAVYVGNTDGTICWYGHMKKNSTTSKSVGDKVSAGEYLGVVGSSGNSTGPHLHFETHDHGGNIIEPFSGPCNNSPSLWASQKPYYEPTINTIMTHNGVPRIPKCPELETINNADTFFLGDSILFASYFHDQTNEKPAFFKIINPRGAVFSSWDLTSPQPYYQASYFYWSWIVDKQWEDGKYTFEVEYENTRLRHDFWIYKEGLPSNISSVSAKEGILIVPNPNFGEFELIINDDQFKDETRLRITNVSGVQVYAGQMRRGSSKKSVKLELPSGVYYLNAVNMQGKYTVKSFVIH